MDPLAPSANATPGVEKQSPSPTGLLPFLRRLLSGTTFTYGISLVILLVALEWWGERHWLLSLLLFAPPALYLLPLAVLAPACLFLRPRLCAIHLLAIIGVGFVYTTFRVGQRRAPGSETFALLSHNVGQGDRQQFAAFVAAQKPDAILLQDARHRGTRYTTLYPDHYVAVRREFILISRHLIQQAAILPEPNWRGRPVAARFEILFQGRPLVLYNVHLPTPRAQLSRFLTGRAVVDMLADDDRPGLTTYREWVAERLKLSRDLAAVFAGEKQPFLVGGDFNTPDHGSIYHLFAGEMRDAFAEAGSAGWQLTFPGTSRNPLSLFGPWLRLDYLFAGRGWAPISCDAEAGRRSQHRAVVGRFDPVKATTP